MTRTVQALVVLAVLLVVAESLVGPILAVPGVFAVGGFVGCVAIVVVSKALGKWWLQHPEPDD